MQTETSTAQERLSLRQHRQQSPGGGNQLMNGFVIAALLLSGCWVLAKSVTVSRAVLLSDQWRRSRFR
ncbi:MAG UNVERIFIED_CONTAM: hypothetical protein LVR18_46535 [Planctomycetaceae bacterium]